MRAKATKTVAAQNMAKRAGKLLAGLKAEHVADRAAKVRFPQPVPCGKTPLTAQALSKYNRNRVLGRWSKLSAGAARVAKIAT